MSPRSGIRPSPRRTSCTSAGCTPRTRSTSTTCSCSRCRSSSASPRRSSAGARRSATSSSTSTRTRTTRSTGSCSSSAASTGTSAPSAIRTSRSTRSAAPTSATSWSSSSDFPGTQVVALEQNYRSTNSILRAANSLIEQNRERKPKRLFSDLGEGDPVRVIEVEDEHAEARFVAAEIASLIGGGRLGAARSRSSTGRTRSRACSRTCSCARTSRTRSSAARGSTSARRSATRPRTCSVLVNPQDATSLLRIANRPRRGIGDTSIQRLVTHAEATGRTLFQAMADPEAAGRRRRLVPRDPRVPRRPWSRSWRSSQELHVDELLERVLEKTGTLDALEAERTIEARGRIENLQELVGVAREYRQSARGSVPRRVPAGHLARLRPGHDPRRARPRDADDAAQREGARVPRRLHDRDGGGGLPALALDRGAGRRGGAAALLRRA